MALRCPGGPAPPGPPLRRRHLAGTHPGRPRRSQPPLRRLAERNKREDANALTVTPEALDDFIDRFDVPSAEEDVIVYTGDLDTLVTQLSTSQGQ
ncbi:hypothetical protein [Streptomyces sp. NPDC053560]|uniref:hypothetical protein n=1 Tax=Streptomyces sp. NPDC053560 TaxID=3365711 RepID=UPI0037D89941